jgi:hypothetical protein
MIEKINLIGKTPEELERYKWLKIDELISAVNKQEEKLSNTITTVVKDITKLENRLKILEEKIEFIMENTDATWNNAIILSTIGEENVKHKSLKDLWDEENMATVKEDPCDDGITLGCKCKEDEEKSDDYLNVQLKKPFNWDKEVNKIMKEDKINEILEEFDKRFFIQDGYLIEFIDGIEYTSNIKEIKFWLKDKLNKII